MGKQEWGFQENHELHAAAAFTIRNILESIMGNIDEKRSGKPKIHLGHGDPSVYPCFRTSTSVEDALVESIRSAKFNCYPAGVGIDPARSAIAELLSKDLPYKIETDDVFLTAGGNHAIEILLTVLGRPGANILFPRPNYPVYEARAKFSPLEVRHYDLLPEKGWEVDLDGVKALADSNTVAIVLINPGNPCGNVFTFDHMQKITHGTLTQVNIDSYRQIADDFIGFDGNSLPTDYLSVTCRQTEDSISDRIATLCDGLIALLIAETAREIGMLIISDEVYAHQVFADKPFIPMGMLGDIAPVLTLGSLSKRWIVPGWRFGWIAITDPTSILQQTGVAGSLKSCLTISADPPTVIQGAIPRVIKNTPKSFFLNINKLLKEAADMFFEKIKEVPNITCPHKPEGSMFAMVKLNIPAFEDVVDDTDFCTKLAKEECMVLFPGDAVCLKNWVRVSFATEPKVLEDAIERMKAFCLRHAKHML